MKRVALLVSAIIFSIEVFSAYNVQYAGKAFDELLKKNGEITLLSSVPANNTIVDRRIDEIVLTFSDEFLPLQSVEDIKIKYTLEPNVEGIFRQRGKNTIVFIPAKPLAPEKKYKLTIQKGILSMDSAVLKKDVVLYLGPVNLKVIHAANTTIHPDSSFLMVFNYPVKISDLKENITLTNKGESIDFDIVKSKKKKDEYGYYYYNNYYYENNEDDTLDFFAVELKPKNTLKSSANYKLKIFMKELMRSSQEYTLYTLGDFKFIHRENIEQIYYNSNSYINIEFTNPAKTEDVFKNVFFINEGKTESLFDYYYSSQSQYFSAYKKLVPGGEYMIKVGENLKDVHGSKIKNPGIYKLIAGDYYPFISFAGGYISRPKNLLIDFSLMNLSKFNMFVKETSVSEFIKEMASNDYGYWNKKTYRNWSKRKYDFKTENNVLYTDTLDIDKEYGRISKLGLGVLEYALGNDTYNIEFSYQVTPLRMHSIMSSKNGFVILSDRKGENFAKGMSTLYVYGMKGNQLFSIPFKDGFLSMNKPQMKWLEVKCNDNAKLLYAENQGSKLLMTYYLPEKIQDTRSYIFTDKNLYKLDDSVLITGIVRNKEGNKIKYSSLKKILYTVTNPDYKEVYKGTVTLDRNGVFSLKLMIPDSFKTGYYYASFFDKKYYSEQVSFMVQEFKEPTFEIAVTATKNGYFYNEIPSINTKGNYLSGMKMAGDSLYSTLIINRTSFYSQKFPGFNFYISNDTTTFNSHAFDQKDTLDKTGEFKYSQDIKYTNVMNPLSVQYIATVKGIDKEGISQSVYFTKYSMENYAGLKISNFTDTDDSTLFEIVVADNQDNPVKGKKLKLRVIREYSYKDSVPDTLKVVNVVSRAMADSLWFKLDKRAYYRVELEYDKTKVTQSFYYGWWWYYDNDKKVLTVTPDKSVYEIGDTARVKIYSPMPELKHFYYYNTDSIYGINEVKFSGDTAFLNIPVTKDLISGFFLSVFALTEDSTNKLQMQTSFISVSSESKRLLFDMKTDREVYEPSDTVEITLETKHSKDVTAVITVVDEAVLMLTEYKYSDPMYAFYGYYENQAYYANSSNLDYPYYYYGYRNSNMMLDGCMQTAPSQAYKCEEKISVADEREMGSDKKQKDGGDVTIAPIPPNVSIRKDFTQLPFYSEKITFSQNKKGAVKFRLPDNIGKFRINCVVLSEDEFNVKEQNIRVEKKIIINQSLPQFLRPFDKINASFVVLDNTGKEGDVKVQINSKQMKFTENNVKTLSTKNNKALALFKGEALFEDSCTFMLSAEKDSFSDYMLVTIPVINHNLYEHSAVFSSSEDDVKEHINISKDIVKEKSSITVSLNSTIIGGMQIPLEFLKDYRYLCLEQKLSRAFPYIIGEEVINLYNLSDIKKDKLRKYVSVLLRDVSDCQASNGGFKYYEDDQYESEYLSLYAMYVLYYAKKGGYNISQDMLDNGLDYIERLIDNNFNEIWSYSEGAKYSLRAYAVYLMMLYGNKNYKDIVEEVYEKRDKIYLAEKARFLQVLSEYSMTREYNQLLGEIKSNARVESAYAYFDDGIYDWWFFASDLKSTAVVLTTLMRTEKKYEYAEYVMNLFNQRLKKGMWVNTHTTALVLEAITEYYKIYEKETPLFTAYLKVNEKSLTSKKFSGRKDQMFSYTVDGKNLKDSMNLLEVKKDGKGRMYYTLRMKYARNKIENALFNGFEVKREYLDLNGKVVTKFKKGEVYQVKITIKTNKWRSFVVLEDNLPAGFETIKREFVTEFVNLAHYNYKRWWWGEFYHEEFYRDRVVANSIYLYEGTHDYSYFVKANVSGEFNVPPVNVFEMYTPEVFGYTASEILTIE